MKDLFHVPNQKYSRQRPRFLYEGPENNETTGYKHIEEKLTVTMREIKFLKLLRLIRSSTQEYRKMASDDWKIAEEAE
ncbi:hypothetical protein [Geobacter sp. DSM 9736]|uniref:hypothetical protein n=1 Tax=Geobacter sp. DSM 9736 TaxID=1277350 RepID=UPI000B512800|nr:hypothetical protein [Geobacter sp. DSM 9736]